MVKYIILAYKIFSMKLKFNNINFFLPKIQLILIIALTFSGSSGYSQTEDATIIKSDSLYRSGAYEEAIKILNQRLKKVNINDKQKLQIVIFNSIGKAYSQLGKSVASLKNYQIALKIAETTDDKDYAGKILKNIGALYEEQKNFIQALAYYKKAENIAIEIKDESLLADVYNNTGIVYEQKLNYPLALKTYQKALSSYEKADRKDRIALTLNNIGIVYKFLGDYPKAISFYSKSLKYSEELGDKFFISANLNNLGNVYAMMHNYPKAIEYNTKSLKIAEDIGATNIIVEALSSLAEDYAGARDFKKAYEMNNKYFKVNSDYINMESSKKLAEMQTLYQTEKQERQISTLKQNEQISALKMKQQELMIQKTNYQIFFVVLFLAITLGISYLLYVRQQYKQKMAQRKAIKDAQSKERSRIAQDVHDDIGSGLSKITLMASSATNRLHQKGLESTEVKAIAQVSKDLVENMRDLIWVLNPENATLDNLVARIREYCSDYLEGCSVSAEMDIQDDIPDIKISQQVQRNIFLTVKEALHNCIKHSDCNSISVKLYFINQELNILITDKGKGFDMLNLKGKGNGLRNMQQRMESIGGVFETKSYPNIGTTIETKIKQEKLQSTFA
jgi:signal transduction histidine kinase